jgi:phage FluMu protein gp41
LIASSELQQARPARQAIVRLHLSGGRTLTQRTVAVRGTVENPMNQREIETKALDLMAPVLGTNRAKRAIEAVANIEGLYDVRRLRPLLASRAR